MQVERGRVGQFFLFVGLISLVIFFTTDRYLHPGVEFFFVGLLSSAFGFVLIWWGYKPSKSSGRFRLIRRKNMSEQDASRE